MPIVFGTGNKLGDYNGYFTNSLNQEGAGAYGSTMANKFLQDVKAGRDCLDIALIGDSNIGYTPGANQQWGWVYGFETALLANGFAPYATTLVPCMHATAANNTAGYLSNLKLDAATDRAQGQNGGTVTEYKVGSTNGGAVASAVANIWRSTGGNYKVFSAALDFGYIPSGNNINNSQGQFGTKILSNSAFDVKSNFVYRVGHMLIPFGSGSFTLLCRKTTAPAANLSSQLFNTASGNDYELSIASLNVPADASRTGDIVFWKLSGFTGAPAPVGPIAFLFESIYRPGVKGFAVNVMNYSSGETTAGMANAYTADYPTVKTYLNELRQRQIAAGGSGRVLVVTSTGVNDASFGTPGVSDISVYAAKAQSIIGTIQKAWAELGYPQSDLAFVIKVSHPTEATDANMKPGRDAAKSSVAFGPGGHVSFVDMNQIVPHNYLTANNMYHSGGNAHLIGTGYVEASSRIVAALLK